MKSPPIVIGGKDLLDCVFFLHGIKASCGSEFGYDSISHHKSSVLSGD